MFIFLVSSFSKLLSLLRICFKKLKLLCVKHELAFKRLCHYIMRILNLYHDRNTKISILFYGICLRQYFCYLHAITLSNKINQFIWGNETRFPPVILNLYVFSNLSKFHEVCWLFLKSICDLYSRCFFKIQTDFCSVNSFSWPRVIFCVHLLSG